MNAKASKGIDRTKILTRNEVSKVLAELKRKAKRSMNSRQNLIIFRLATCCGLRVSEVVGLKVGNVKVTGDRPYILVPKEIAKRHKTRKVPLWWDAATLADLTSWKAEREGQGQRLATLRLQSGQGNPSQDGQSTFGKPLAARNAEARFKAAIKLLGRNAKRNSLSIVADIPSAPTL